MRRSAHDLLHAELDFLLFEHEIEDEADIEGFQEADILATNTVKYLHVTEHQLKHRIG